MTCVLCVFFLALALNVNSEVPPRAMLGSPSRSDLRQTQWTLWEPDMVRIDRLFWIFWGLFHVCSW